MQKQLVFFLFFISFFGWSQAQVSVNDLIFDKTTHNFGTVFSNETALSAKYTFTNTSTNILYVNDVDASCGCTNPRVTKDTVYPGESASILAEFNPTGFFGHVTKHVYMRGNFTDAYQVELEFVADVQSEYNASKDQPYYKGQFGYLVLEKTDFSWGNILSNSQFTDTLKLINDGYHDITISKMVNTPQFATIRNLPLTLAPNTKSYLLLDVDLTKIDTVGSVYSFIQFATNDRFFPQKEISYNFNAVIDYTKMKKRHVRKAPHIFLSTNAIEMGEMYSGTIRTKKVTISNNGKSDLKLQRIDSDCTCALLEPRKRILKPGESVEVEVKYDSIHKKGVQVKRINIYTNDPINPLITIFVHATVKSKG